MIRKKLPRVILFVCVMAVITTLIYVWQSGREKQKVDVEAKEKQVAIQKEEQQRQQAEKEAATAKAIQLAAAEHQMFVEKYVDTGVTKRPGSQMVAVAVASENNSMNHAVGVALISRFKTDRVQLTDSFFKPELVTGGLFNSAFNGSTDLFNKLELVKSLNALLLARQNVQYETNTDLNNIITASMSLEIAVLPVVGQIQSQSWMFTANGTGFRRNEARMQAEERIIKQIQTDTKMSLGF